MARPRKGVTAIDRWWSQIHELAATDCWQWTKPRSAGNRRIPSPSPPHKEPSE